MKKYQNYINGVWTDPASAQWLETENPYGGETWAEIPRSNAADAARAAAAAKAAFEGEWSGLTATHRGKLLVKLAEIVERESARLGEQEVRDNGKLIAEMGAQTKYLAEWYRYFGGFKRSGQGRESGQESIKEFLQVKSVWIAQQTTAANPFVLR